jgi:hypothetical protein
MALPVPGTVCLGFHLPYAMFQKHACKCPGLQARILNWGRWKLFPRIYFPGFRRTEGTLPTRFDQGTTREIYPEEGT